MFSKTETPRSARKGLGRGVMMAALLGLMLAFAGWRCAHADTGADLGADGGALNSAMEKVLTVRSADADDRFLGSAFLWGGEAEVAVTNAHVVGEADEVRLVDRNGSEEIGLVIARDAVRDVAVIAVGPGADGNPRRGLVPSPDVAVLGLKVFALGAPLGMEFTLTEGLISAKARQVDEAVPLMMLQHDAAVNPGSSGGPLVDAQGRLIGMNSQIADGSRMFVGIAYAIAAPDLDRIVAGLIEETLAPFPALGLKARPVDRKVADMLGLEPGGLLVDGTTKGGLAEAAGVKAGDVILAVNGVAIAEPGDLAFQIEAAQAGAEASLTLLRDGAQVELSLAFALAEAEDGIGIGWRDFDAKTRPERISSYRMVALGVILDDAGRIEDVTENSPGLHAGLGRGDSILAVNGVAMDGAALDALEVSRAVMLLVQAPDGTTRHIFLDPWGGKDGVRPVGGANVLDPSVIVF